MNSQRILAQIGGLSIQQKQLEMAYAVALEDEIKQAHQEIQRLQEEKKEPKDGEKT